MYKLNHIFSPCTLKVKSAVNAIAYRQLTANYLQDIVLKTRPRTQIKYDATKVEQKHTGQALNNMSSIKAEPTERLTSPHSLGTRRARRVVGRAVHALHIIRHARPAVGSRALVRAMTMGIIIDGAELGHSLVGEGAAAGRGEFRARDTFLRGQGDVEDARAVVGAARSVVCELDQVEAWMA
jgi:hypothetical protein